MYIGNCHLRFIKVSQFDDPRRPLSDQSFVERLRTALPYRNNNPLRNELHGLQFQELRLANHQ